MNNLYERYVAGLELELSIPVLKTEYWSSVNNYRHKKKKFLNGAKGKIFCIYIDTARNN